LELKVLVEEATEVLAAHREIHIFDYKEALATWREDLAAYTHDLTVWAREMQGNRPSQPSPPRNYLGEYDKMIAKLHRHKDVNIILSDKEYSIIFEDEFYWQSSFQRQKAPIYTMGDPISFNSGTSISGGSVVGGSISTSKLNLDSLNTDYSDGLHVPLEDE
jgi:hypothetical protein